MRGGKEMKETQERKPYEKPGVVFEKDLEVMAGLCDVTGDRLYSGGGVANYCKAEGFCTGILSS
jgi:hypothetical protein